MDMFSKWDKILNPELSIFNSKKHLNLPRLEWNEYLSNCLALSGINHPSFVEYMRENNARGYAVLIESQETWTP